MKFLERSFRLQNGMGCIDPHWGNRAGVGQGGVGIDVSRNKLLNRMQTHLGQ